MISALRTSLSAGIVAIVSQVTNSDTTYEVLEFQDLDGWHSDGHEATFSVFLNTCADLKGQTWQSICVETRADKRDTARSVSKDLLQTVLIRDSNEPLFAIPQANTLLSDGA